MTTQNEILEFAEKFQNDNCEAVEYPVDQLQSFLLNVLVSRKFDNKKTARDLCDAIFDKYRDCWIHGVTLLKNICTLVNMDSSSIPACDTYLVRIANRIEENTIHKETMMRRVFLILEKIKRPTPQLVETGALLAHASAQKLSHYRTTFKACWVEFLRGSVSLLDRELFKKLLRIIPDSVMPHITDPEIFSSFFSNCFEQKDDVEIALLSISGLFQLISRYNLGEPDFLYARIYELLSPQTMDNTKSATSNRVFQMLLKALRSPLMPSKYIPIFSKKLLRIAVLVNNPSLTLWLVVATFSLMQANPLVATPLVHTNPEDFPSDITSDPFSMECKDIEEALNITTGKISLWELELLMKHSDPSVVRMSQLFATNFFAKKAKRISSDDFVFITTQQLFNRERKYGSHARPGKKQRADGEMEEDLQTNPAGDNLAIPLAVSSLNAIEMNGVFKQALALV